MEGLQTIEVGLVDRSGFGGSVGKIRVMKKHNLVARDR